MAGDGPVRVGRIGRAYLVGTLLALLIGISVPALPAPQIDVSVGLSGYFVPMHIAPLRVTLSGVDPAFIGSLQLIEEVGNAWRGEARTSFCIPVDGGPGTYEAAVPIYDFSHSLLVSLLDEEQHVIAHQEAPLRDQWRSEPFVVLAGRFPAPAAIDAVQISQTELPTNWLSYEGAASVWLGRTSYEMTTAQQEAIYRWTSAGGRTVLFTGSDFFRIDSPLIRQMLPLADPHLTDANVLSGDARTGANVLLRDSAGAPLVISRKLGAGEVFLVTVDAFSLSPGEYGRLRDLVPAAELLDLDEVTRSLLEQMPLTRPGFPTTIALVVVLLLSLVVITSRVRNGANRIILLISVVVACSVWSGLYSNRTKQLCDIYGINTSIEVQTVLGYVSTSCGLIYLGGANPAEPLVRVDGGVLQELPRDLNEEPFDIDLRCDGNALIGMSPGQVRVLRGGSDAAPSIDLFLDGDGRVEIDNGLGVSLPHASVISDAKSFELGSISPGVHAYSLTRETSGIKEASAELAALYAAVSKAYDLSVGTWLVGGTTSDSVVERGDYRQKVRDVKLFLVEGEKR